MRSGPKKMAPFTLRGVFSGTAAMVVAGVLCSPSFAVSPARLSGAISGLVHDGSGVPQMGASVLLFNHEERLFARVLTDEKGNFAFLSLAPDVYSIRVSLRSFVPVFRHNIVVQPGVRSVLNVNLTTLFSTIQLTTPPAGDGALMSDDWKWVLRSASATRPVLRILPDLGPDNVNHPSRRATAVFSETRGLVKLTGGDGGQVSGFGNEADLGTAFAFATSLFGDNQVAVSGNLGYTAQSGMASAGFRTSYTRNLGSISPAVSLTMRQLVLPRVGETLISGPGALGDLPALRTMSVSLGDRARLSDALSLDYGFALDAVTFLDRLHYFSPYARLRYKLSDTGELDFSYTSGNARPDLASDQFPGSELQRDINALSILPRMSLRNGQAKVQRGEDMELAYSRKIGSRTYRVSGYRERVTNTALTMASQDGGLYASGDILPDLFSSSYIFDAGDYHTLGYSASVTQNLGENFNTSVMYGSTGVLVARSDEAASDSADDLRSIIRASRRHAVTTRASGTIPKTGTHFIASYQWMDPRAMTPGHLYSTEPLRPEAGLNIYVRQPIPTFFSLPWRMEATADLRNLLAQGYLPISIVDGRNMLLVETPRSVRGGLSFIF